MKPPLVIFALACLAAALNIPPASAPTEAAPVVIDHSAELASLKAELESLRAALKQATLPPETVPVATVTNSTAGGGAVCANGSCGARGPVRRVFAAQPVRRLFQNRPRILGRLFGRR